MSRNKQKGSRAMGILSNLANLLGGYGEPEIVEDDPRIGRPATSSDGETGVVESVYRFRDGYETIAIGDPATGLGSLDEASQFTIEGHEGTAEESDDGESTSGSFLWGLFG